MRKFIILSGLTSMLFLGACGGDEKTEETKEVTNSGDKVVGKSKLVAQDNVPVENLNKSLTNIRFDEIIHDFGRVSAVSENKYMFSFTNTGQVPLVIKNVKASCGCTIPKKPEEPIAPGEKGEIEVVFKPKPTQAGTTVNKTVTITANIPGGTTIVKIKADVNPVK